MKKDRFLNLPDWLKQNVFYRADLRNNYSDEPDKAVEVHPLDANLISSQKPSGQHALLLDLDVDSYYRESSTSGHAHLYLDTKLDLEALTEIINVLAKHGIVQEGIKRQLTDRQFLSLRPPGVTKGTNDDLPIEEYKKILTEPKKTFKPKVYKYPIPTTPVYLDVHDESWHHIGYEIGGAISEKIEVPVHCEVVSQWLESLANKLGQYINISKNDTEVITKYRLSLDAIDQFGITQKRGLAVGVYDPQHDLIRFTFDKETCPVDWTDLKIAIGGV